MANEMLVAQKKNRPLHIGIILLGALGNSLVWGTGTFLQFHARLPTPSGFGLSELEIGFIWGLSAVFAAVSNVLWGAASDRTRTRWGKRKPYMLLFAPITMIFLWISVSVDVLFGLELVFWNLLVWTTLQKITHAGANVPYSSVIPEVVPPQKRVAVSQISAFVNGIGFALGAVVPTIIFEVSDNFPLPFLVAGGALVITYYIAASVMPPEQYRVVPVSVLNALRTTFQDRNFMRFEIAQFLWTLALNMIGFILPFLAQDLLGIREESTFGWLFISFLLIAGVFLFLINWLVEKRKIAKKKALMASLIFTAAALPFFGLIGSPVLSFLPVLGQAYAAGTLIFAGLIGIMIFPYAILMALINYERGTEATYNGVNGFILGLAAIPAGPLGAAILLLGYPIMGFICSGLFWVSLVVMQRVNVPEHLFQKKSEENQLK